ncbi:MAG: M28 family peptidase [Paludibaculum sp.]
MALWSAESRACSSSQAYVKEHFGSFEEPKAEFGKLVAYFNIDSGTGRVRMANVFGPQEAADVLKSALDPFAATLGVAGASAPPENRRNGGTDSTSFNAAGLAGIGLGQDPIEYFVHHLAHVSQIPTNGSCRKTPASTNFCRDRRSPVWHLANRR